MSTPMPRLVSSRMMRWISSTESGSTPAKGSSSSMKRGSAASARDLDAPPLAARKGEPEVAAHVSDAQLLEQLLEALLARRALEIASRLQDGEHVVFDRQ